MSVLNVARVISLSFHSGTTNQPALSTSTLTREVEKFWIQTYIPFDPEKSLVHPLQFLQNKCNAMVGVTGFFLIKDLFLSSELTDQGLITQKFEHTLQDTCHGGLGTSKERVFHQEVRVLNPSRGRAHRALGVQLKRFLKLEEKYNKELEMGDKGIDVFSNKVQCFFRGDFVMRKTPRARNSEICRIEVKSVDPWSL